MHPDDLTDLGIESGELVVLDSKRSSIVAIAEADRSIVRVVAESVRSVNVFAMRGVALEYGMTWHLPRVAGQARAIDMLLSGRGVRAREALEWGLPTHLVSGDPVAVAQEYAVTLARQPSPSSLAASKWQTTRVVASRYWRRDRRRTTGCRRPVVRHPGHQLDTPPSRTCPTSTAAGSRAVPSLS
jgi:hypothetical protein